MFTKPILQSKFQYFLNLLNVWGCKFPFGVSLWSLGANLLSLRDKSGLVVFREKSGCRKDLGIVFNASDFWFVVRVFKSRWGFVRSMCLKYGESMEHMATLRARLGRRWGRPPLGLDVCVIDAGFACVLDRAVLSRVTGRVSIWQIINLIFQKNTWRQIKQNSNHWLYFP